MRSRRRHSFFYFIFSFLASARVWIKATIAFLKFPYRTQLKLSIENNFPRLMKLYVWLGLASVSSLNYGRRPILDKPINRELNKKNSDFEIIKWLCQNGADANGRFVIEFDGCTAPITIFPAVTGNIPLFNILYENGAILNGVDDQRSTLLMYACGKRFWCSIKVAENETKEERMKLALFVEFLLKKGANPYYIDGNNMKAIGHACFRDQWECAQILINNSPFFFSHFDKEDIENYFKKTELVDLRKAIFIDCMAESYIHRLYG